MSFISEKISQRTPSEMSKLYISGKKLVIQQAVGKCGESTVR